ncbi:hexaprenyldihydroxybenzoate methyltransferase Coq3 [Schizosaccharomyces cryophilus OY26]|uniref:Ubiquinone biosynthesis O-methyltransferase, mitochondrial n=1 Tax=Schizosaccharomyces cryophilus (strain OY26 / ATCC MYA-4695 / CBS 11777 / NBRC 106824 / NRRL Y48691) TaxID=653667 RepID=S9X2N3_SCHCR|nr:hexaprenyldihydroxybenzoate methyltransferase Coq3 [Schizosaccharomyces cryophilus OY26]EPY51337.1 hexaprenyldihydroxybenzoate methyltransferase Coq3 [Schizosaccharomyces cryophilus OY26]
MMMKYNLLRSGYKSFERGLLGSLSQQRNHTVSNQEIQHFDALAKTWWDWDGESRLLHLMNPTRIDFMSQIIREKTPFAGKQVLDIGCGGGILSESMARLGANVTGVDASKKALDVAKDHSEKDPKIRDRLKYIHGPIEKQNFDKQFNIVTCMEVVEHVTNPRDFLESLMNLVKPNGYLMLSTISRTFMARVLTIFLAEKVLGIVPDGTHDYQKYIRPEELAEFFREHHWKVNDVRGVMYHPLQSKWILAKPGDSCLPPLCNYMLSAQKP